MRKTMMLCLLILLILTHCATRKPAQPAPEKQSKEKPVHCYDAKEPPYQYKGPNDPFENDTGGIYSVLMAHSELPLKDVNDLADVDIAGKLFCLYLDTYKSPDKRPTLRLTEYKIDDVTQVKDAEGQIFFDIHFSVHPYKKIFYEKSGMPSSTDWLDGGGGKITKDGWIGTMMYVRLVKIEDQVRMILVGTGL